MATRFAARVLRPSSGLDRIAIIAPPWYPLPPIGYGGIEQVVWLLVRELRARGHAVVVFGAEGSRDGVAELAPAAWSADLGTPVGPARELSYLARVFEAITRSGPFDVLHDHSGFAGLLGSVLVDAGPVVHTVHGPLGSPARTFYAAMRGRAGLVALSEHQRSTGPGLGWIATVPNAVDLSALWLASRQDKERYLICLARICPEKGQHTAIEVARRTGMRLVLAGKVEPSDEGRRYYRDRILPHLDGDRVVHLQNAAGEVKAELLARGTALLAPIAWDEPFGLAVVEAMASGTPAISFARGAAPELVRDGETGFLVDDVDAMVDAVLRVGALDPARCAAVTRARFNPGAMVDGYRQAYRAITRTHATAIAADTRPGEPERAEGAIA